MDRSAALRLAIVLLVVVVLIMAIPLAIPMASGGCPECPGVGTNSLAGICVAILVGLLLLAWAGGSTLLAERSRCVSRIFARSFERPPRTA